MTRFALGAKCGARGTDGDANTDSPRASVPSDSAPIPMPTRARKSRRLKPGGANGCMPAKLTRCAVTDNAGFRTRLPKPTKWPAMPGPSHRTGGRGVNELDDPSLSRVSETLRGLNRRRPQTRHRDRRRMTALAPVFHAICILPAWRRLERGGCVVGEDESESEGRASPSRRPSFKVVLGFSRSEGYL